jgi:hypothetical protein
MKVAGRRLQLVAYVDLGAENPGTHLGMTDAEVVRQATQELAGSLDM